MQRARSSPPLAGTALPAPPALPDLFSCYAAGDLDRVLRALDALGSALDAALDADVGTGLDALAGTVAPGRGAGGASPTAERPARGRAPADAAEPSAAGDHPALERHPRVPSCESCPEPSATGVSLATPAPLPAPPSSARLQDRLSSASPPASSRRRDVSAPSTLAGSTRASSPPPGRAAAPGRTVRHGQARTPQAVEAPRV